MMPLALPWVLALALGQTAPFSWSQVEIPRLSATIPLHGTMQAGDVPVRARQYVSAEDPQVLARHFRRVFTEARLYIPPPSAQLKVEQAYQLTALDPERLLSFTVILAPVGDGQTVVTLGEASLQRLGARPAADPLVPEGASDVLSVNQEGARTLSFRTARTQGEVEAFYRERLGGMGYREPEPLRFRAPGRQVSVIIKPQTEGTQVLLDIRWAASPRGGDDAK